MEAKDKTRTINYCDVDEMDPDHDDPPDQEPEPSEDADNPLLEYLCGNTDDSSYGDIREVLATKRTKRLPPKKKPIPEQHSLKMNQHEVTKKGEYSVSTLYMVSAHNRRQKGSLVDRGANGGMAGDDVRILTHTGQYVDVGGIDGHTVKDLELVTAAGLVDTNVGPRIVILNQYAYLGKGKTIHSSGQLEHFKHEVWDKSKKVGGQQCIITPDGIVLPLAMRSGLPYLDMKVPTLQEIEDIPHIHLTADTPWDPCVLDAEFSSTQATAIHPIETRPSNDPFNEVGEFVDDHTPDLPKPQDIIAMSHLVSAVEIGVSTSKDDLLDKLFNNEVLQAYLTAYQTYKEDYLTPEDEFVPLDHRFDPYAVKGSPSKPPPILELSTLSRRLGLPIIPGEQPCTTQNHFF
jgi:hypothetical protein